MPLNRQLQMLRESILHPEPKDEAQSEIAPTETPAEDETISERSSSASDEETSATQSEATPSAEAPAESETATTEA